MNKLEKIGFILLIAGLTLLRENPNTVGWGGLILLGVILFIIGDDFG